MTTEGETSVPRKFVEFPAVDSDVESLDCSSLATPSTAPSALRRGKYSRQFYAGFERSVSDSDIDQDAAPTSRKKKKKKRKKKNRGDDYMSHSGESSLYPESCNSQSPDNDVVGDGVKRSGPILSRTSQKSLVFRRWRGSYWVHFHPATLLVFRSEEDFLKWRENGGCQRPDASNDKLIKFIVDFDAMGRLKKKAEKKNRDKTARHSETKDTKKSLPASRKIIKFAISDVHAKQYKRNGPVTYGFKVERWTEVGTSVVAAFGSSSQNEVRSLRKALKECIKITSPDPKRKKKGKGSSESWNCESVTQPGTSVVSGMSGMSENNRTGGPKGRGDSSVCTPSDAGSVASSFFSSGEDDLNVKIRRRRGKYSRPSSSVLS